mgnify:CR=1 FL=1
MHDFMIQVFSSLISALIIYLTSCLKKRFDKSPYNGYIKNLFFFFLMYLIQATLLIMTLRVFINTEFHLKMLVISTFNISIGLFSLSGMSYKLNSFLVSIFGKKTNNEKKN